MRDLRARPFKHCISFCSSSHPFLVHASQGTAGEKGIKGEKGEKGDTGLRGEAGSPGLKGEAGAKVMKHSLKFYQVLGM